MIKINREMHPMGQESSLAEGRFYRLGRITFAKGTTGKHVWSFMVLALFSTCMMATINFLQPLLLTEFLGVPLEAQGTIAGNLVFWNELVILSVIGLLGSWSDKVGRSLIYGFGFLILSSAYYLFTRVTSLESMTAVRIYFAIGAAAVNGMLATVMVDYPNDHSRGKFTGLIGILTGLGIMMIVFVFSKLPSWFEPAAKNSRESLEWTLMTISLLCLILAILAALGLKRQKVVDHDKKPTLELFKEALKAAQKNPRIRLAYAAAFVSRGDLAIVGTFLSLWIVNSHVGKGLSSAQALKQAGMIFGISQGAALLWAPIIGILCDRLGRTQAVALALFLASLGYTLMGFITEPTGAPMILACVLLGIGEISAVISSQSLIGEQAPEQSRGSVVGAFGFFGAIGILIATKIGGKLFDQIAPSAPFVVIGLVNACVFGLALWTLKNKSEKSPGYKAPLASSST
jgi:MFS family permease